jgi:phytoene/squalene synthetase
VLIFYDFVRGADQISDDPTLSDVDKQQALAQLKQQVDMRQKEALPLWAQPYVQALEEGLFPPDYGDALLQAFMQDARQHRYATTDALLEYCRYSANPVGHLVLHACGEEAADRHASDALCTVLQILNHLQDIREDYMQRERIYLPQDRMAHYGVREDMLALESETPQLTALKKELLDVCAGLLEEARKLFGGIRSRRVRMEIRWIWWLACGLEQTLRREDVMARHVKPSRADTLLALWQAVWPLRGPQSSFAPAMRLLPRRRREALQAIYQFCHAVDHLADEVAPEEAEAGLQQWEGQLAAQYRGEASALPEKLKQAISTYGLKQEPFLAMIAGMRSDMAGEMLRPPQAALATYCYRVAGCAGLLSVPVFGCRMPQSNDFAVALGHVLQRINIWRDIEQDARRGRIYLPLEWLQAEGLAELTPQAVAVDAFALRAKLLPYMQREVEHYARQARGCLTRQDAFALFPAYVMALRYRLLWKRMQRGQSACKRRRDIPLVIAQAMGCALMARCVAH